VIIGATLISASFLVAMLLNRSASIEQAPASEPPPASACEPDRKSAPPSPKPDEEEPEACKDPASEPPRGGSALP
jgi:hypothetical protein